MMMIRTLRTTPALWVAVLPALLASMPATAAERYSAEYTGCMNQAASTVAMMECNGTELKRQDARLNAAYKKLGVAIAAPRKPALVAAQRAWVAFRDANCRYVADPDGGSNARVEAAMCLLDMTETRAKELEALAAKGP